MEKGWKRRVKQVGEAGGRGIRALIVTQLVFLLLAVIAGILGWTLMNATSGILGFLMTLFLLNGLVFGELFVRLLEGMKKKRES